MNTPLIVGPRGVRLSVQPPWVFGYMEVDIQSSRQPRRLVTCMATTMGPDPRLHLYHVQLYLIR
jgi:hypothetical protein